MVPRACGVELASTTGHDSTHRVQIMHIAIVSVMRHEDLLLLSEHYIFVLARLGGGTDGQWLHSDRVTHGLGLVCGCG